MSKPERNSDQENGRGTLHLAWARQYTLVFEFLAALGLCGYAGRWLEQRYGFAPWGLFSGLMVGLAVGVYRMLRESQRWER